MLMRKMFVVVGPLLLCALTCVLFRWLDALTAGFFQYALKGLVLGLCTAAALPVAGLSMKSTGLTGWLFVAAGLLILTLAYQYMETVGLVHWPAVLAVIGVNGEALLAESAFAGFLALTGALNVKRRG